MTPVNYYSRRQTHCMIAYYASSQKSARTGTEQTAHEEKGHTNKVSVLVVQPFFTLYGTRAHR